MFKTIVFVLLKTIAHSVDGKSCQETEHSTSGKDKGTL